MIKEAWLKSNDLRELTTVPLYELLLLLELFTGIALGLILSIINDIEFNLASLVLAFLFAGYQYELLVRVLQKTPPIYRVKNRVFKRYFAFLTVRTNDLLVLIMSTSIFLGLFSSVSLSRIFWWIFVNTAIWLFLISPFLTFGVLAKIVVGLVLVCNEVVYLKINNNNFVLSVNFLSTVTMLFMAQAVIKPSNLKKRTQRAVANSSNLFVNVFLGVLKTAGKSTLIYSIALFFYIFFTLKFNVTNAILPLLPFFILFEGIIYLQVNVSSQDYQAGRAFFLAVSQKKFNVFWGSQFTLITLPLFIIYLVVAPTLVVLGMATLLQACTTGLWSLLLIGYLSKQEIKSVIVKKNLPGFAAEYLILLINVGLLFI